jgi:Peptidase propeptide and YPEB domain
VKNGQKMQFDADAHTGAIISEKPNREDIADKDWISLEQLAQKLRKDGYVRITKIEAEKGRWEGKGVKNGQEMKFHADALKWTPFGGPCQALIKLEPTPL